MKRWVGTGVSPSYYRDRYGDHSTAECFPPVHCPMKMAPRGRPLRGRSEQDVAVEARVERLLRRDERPVVPYSPPRRMGEDQAPRLLSSVRPARELELLLTEHIVRKRRSDPAYAHAFNGSDVRTELHDTLMRTMVLQDQLEAEVNWSVSRYAHQAPLEWMQAAALLPQLRLQVREALSTWLLAFDAVSMAMVRDR